MRIFQDRTGRLVQGASEEDGTSILIVTTGGLVPGIMISREAKPIQPRSDS